MDKVAMYKEQIEKQAAKNPIKYIKKQVSRMPGHPGYTKMEQRFKKSIFDSNINLERAYNSINHSAVSDILGRNKNSSAESAIKRSKQNLNRAKKFSDAQNHYRTMQGIGHGTATGVGVGIPLIGAGESALAIYKHKLKKQGKKLNKDGTISNIE